MLISQAKEINGQNQKVVFDLGKNDPNVGSLSKLFRLGLNSMGQLQHYGI